MPSPKDKEKLLKKKLFLISSIYFVSPQNCQVNLMQDDLRFHLWRYRAQRLQDSKQLF